MTHFIIPSTSIAKNRNNKL